MLLNGEVRRFDAMAASREDARSLSTGTRRLWPSAAAGATTLWSCRVPDALVTSCFAVIDTGGRHLFLDQTYTHVETIFPTRFKLAGDRFTLETDPRRIAGEVVVVGGPIDTVWYHWLFSWCPRLLLVQALRPDLLRRPEVRFLVHPLALAQPYRAILDTFGIAGDRLIPADPAEDYRIEQAHLVSFLDQQVLFPDLIRRFADQLLDHFHVRGERRHSGLFASRQRLPSPRRRIHNFREVAPVLHRHGLRVVELGETPAREQARLFHTADIVAGAHGSDLSNILFCRPGTPVVVIENEASVAHRLHVGLQTLAEILELDYHLLVSPTTLEPAGPVSAAVWQSRDYVVDPARLDAVLSLARGPARANG